MRDVPTAPAMVIVKIITSLPDIVKESVGQRRSCRTNDEKLASP